MDAWDFEVDRSDFSKTRCAPSDANGPLADGEARLAVESFSLTANNITYAAIGDSFGYWRFYPAAEGYGRIPVWGFARVVESKAPGIEEGLRLFGYWPMSNQLRARLAKGPYGYVETSPHRAALPATYNSYMASPADPLDDYRSLLRPLLGTSFLIDDQLSEDPSLTDVVLSSASSKTALALAYFAHRRGLKVTGVTSAGNVAMLDATGLFNRILTYDALGALTVGGPTAYVDFAAKAGVTAKVHERAGGNLKHSLLVGLTHRDPQAAAPPATGPAPVLFFAPTRMQQRLADWGPPVFAEKFTTALGDFVIASPWLTLRHHEGPDALAAIYQQVLAGEVRPEDGHIVRP